VPLEEPDAPALPGVVPLGAPGVVFGAPGVLFGAPGVVFGAPGVAGVPVCGEPGDVLVPDTPVVGGVVVAPGPVPGAHGTAVPLVPVGVDAAAAESPVLRAVVLTLPLDVAPLLGLLPGVAAADAAVLPLPDADAVAEGDPVPEAGPVSVAVFTRPFDEVVVPVELFA
jgi:hypothetical protein